MGKNCGKDCSKKDCEKKKDIVGWVFKDGKRVPVKKKDKKES